MKRRNKITKSIKRTRKKYSNTNDLDRSNNHDLRYMASPPPIFSFEQNFDETTLYFNDLIHEMQRKIRNRKFYFNFENVEMISVDSIMYLLSLLYNLKGTKYLNYRYYGNKSKNKEVNDILERSGFYEYVHNDRNRINPVKNIKIINGKQCDPVCADMVCDFVEKKFINPAGVNNLYNLFIELMGNTVQHAYEKSSSIFVRKWYLYAEELTDTYSFVFLDTGVGIPKTVRKKLHEHIAILAEDSKLIKSALKGEDRSQTRENNRGTGLPYVKEFGEMDFVSDFMIISGYGLCQRDEKNELEKCIKQKTEFNGTLFKWKIIK